MTTETNEDQNPFTRPWFIVSAVVVALIVVVGIVVTVVAINRPDATPTPGPQPSTSAGAQPSESAAPSTDAASVCGLRGDDADTLTSAPEAMWEFQGTTGYPVSPAVGPGLDEDGVRTCFQHSPAGALFFAANAVAQGSDPVHSAAWAEQALADGPYRDDLLTQVGASDKTGTRTQIVGFRVLNYAADTATVDVAVRVTTEAGDTGYGSGVYSLVWQDGDWKLSADIPVPLDLAALPDTAGYIPWGK